MINQDKHQELVLRLKKPSGKIMEALGPHEVDAIHFALGLAGEAGEVVDMVKKTTINGHAGDPEAVLNEIGDVLFYIQGLLQLLGYTIDDALMANITKLECRYPDGYSDQASIDRVDTAEQAWKKAHEADPYTCLHPRLVWGGVRGYVCSECGEPAASVQEDIA